MALRTWLVLVLLTLPLAGNSAVYSWVDENGNKHFSDEPPPDDARQSREEDIRIINVDEGYPPGIVHDPDRAARQQEQAKQQAATDAERREACQRARREMATLSGRVIFRDEDDNEVYVSEKERAAMARKYRASIEEHCG